MLVGMEILLLHEQNKLQKSVNKRQISPPFPISKTASHARYDIHENEPKFENISLWIASTCHTNFKLSFLSHRYKTNGSHLQQVNACALL